MDDMQKSEIQTITAEIKMLKQQTAQNIIQYGKAVLGEDATLKQIFNYVAPHFGLAPEDCRELLFHVRGENDG